MKIYLNISDDVQQLLDEQSIDLKELINENIDGELIKEIKPTENPLGAEGGKSIVGLIMVTGKVLLVSAAIFKALKTLYDAVGLIEKKYRIRRAKKENNYVEIIKEELKEGEILEETDEVYVEIIKEALK